MSALTVVLVCGFMNFLALNFWDLKDLGFLDELSLCWRYNHVFYSTVDVFGESIFRFGISSAEVLVMLSEAWATAFYDCFEASACQVTLCSTDSCIGVVILPDNDG